MIYPRLLTEFGMLVFFKNLSIIKFPARFCDLLSSILSNRQLRVVLDGKSSQEYPVKAGVSIGPFLVLHFSYNILMTFLIMLSVISIRHLICGNN